MRILVVEDTEDSRVLLVDQLAAQGYEVDAAENGIAALQTIHRCTPDVIISDILMPEMDGFELCQKLKADDNLKTIPAIFYTATYTEPSDQKFALSMGATRFIIKPEDPAKLFQQVAEVAAEAQSIATSHEHSPSLGANTFTKQHTETLSKKLYKKIHELEEQKEQLRIITDAIPEMIAEIDASGCYQYANSAYEKWLQVPDGELIGKAINDVIAPEVLAVIQPYMERVKKGEEVSFEAKFPDSRQELHYLKMHYIPRTMKGGKYNGFFSFTYDLTEQKRVEKEQEKLKARLKHSEKMEALGQLAGGIAHDFNNILTAIIGYSEFIEIEAPRDSSISKNIGLVLQAGKRAAALVEKILSCSHQHHTEKHSLEPHIIVKEALEMLRAALPSTITIEEDINTESGRILADPTVIHQIIVNLCTNAMQAMAEQKGILQVSLQRKQLSAAEIGQRKGISPGNFIVLTVEDNGSGIEPAVLERIFDPYFTTKQIGKGTGLGLAITQRAVEDCKGFIEVKSEPNIGTIFTIYLPCLEEAVLLHPQKTVTKRRGVASQASTILVVDDEPLLSKLHEIRLTNAGYQVTAANTSKEALQIFQKNPDKFNLLITDQTMPGLTGEELIQEVFAITPSLPVIMCTGHSDLVSKEKAFALGIKKYILKPLLGNELLDAVGEVLSEH